MTDDIQHIDIDAPEFDGSPRALREHVAKLQAAHKSLIQNTYQQALVGGAARSQGLNADGSARLVELGITEREALQGYGVISEAMPSANRLSDIYGEDLDQGDLESEVFENNGDSTRKRKRLASRERAAFQGTSGVGQGSLSRRDNGSY